MEKGILTYENHPDLRWFTKEIAINKNGRFNHKRNLFYDGHKNGTYPKECDCTAKSLISLDKLKP